MTVAPRVPSTRPLAPPPVEIPSGTDAMTGPPVAAIDRLKLFDSNQWEQFVLEWADSLSDQYESVEQYGGANDLGCDVVAYLREDAGAWDNYQCKHYDHRLAPSDAWPEIVKLLVHTYRGALSVPRSYIFVAPQGAGTTLARLLRQPDQLGSRLLETWDEKGSMRTDSRTLVELDEGLRAHVASFDFSIFRALPPLQLLDQHAQTRWHVARFGGGLPVRPPIPTPPEGLTAREAVYVTELLGAYGEHLGEHPSSVGALTNHPEMEGHFNDARIAFYSAEGLRLFSRDTLPPGSFGELQGDVHVGIKNDVRHPHPNGYARVLAATNTAQSLSLSAHALGNTASVLDRHGICHQLANEGKVKWTT
jgi:hypothetical protein